MEVASLLASELGLRVRIITVTLGLPMQAIAEVELAAEGFTNAAELAVQLTQLLALADGLLSD